MSDFPERHTQSKTETEVELDLSNYATRSDTSDLTKQDDWVNLKSDVDKLDFNKLKTVPSNLRNLISKVDKLDIGNLEITPVDLSKVSGVVKSGVVEKDEYDEFVKKLTILRLLILAI